MWHRILADTLVALALAWVLALLGFSVSVPLLTTVSEIAGIHDLFIAAPSDLSAFQVGIATMFALPPVVAWFVALVARSVERSAPALPALAAHLSVLALATAAGLAAKIWWIRQTISAPPATGIDPKVTLESLALASSGALACLAAGAVLAFLAGFRARVRATTRP